MCSEFEETQANLIFGMQIGEVKEKISKEKGWEAVQQKLIYSGMCKVMW